MNLRLEIINNEDLNQFKQDMQESFQMSFEAKYGKTDKTVLPIKDIDSSINTKGAISYKAILNDEMVGGAVVVINKETHINSLHILYVKNGVQSKGIGKMIWDEIEKKHPDTIIWETCTPYFDKRNIYFYVNKCGFHIVKYLRNVNEEGFIGDGGEGMFEFKKYMKQNILKKDDKNE